jgi:hypothetical protein
VTLACTSIFLSVAGIGATDNDGHGAHSGLRTASAPGRSTALALAERAGIGCPLKRTATASWCQRPPSRRRGGPAARCVLQQPRAGEPPLRQAPQFGSSSGAGTRRDPTLLPADAAWQSVFPSPRWPGGNDVRSRLRTDPRLDAAVRFTKAK